MTRNPALDVLRGMLLVMMTLTHLPTVWQGALVEPLGYVSAAEGFVFLSAFLAGRLYLGLHQNQSPRAARQWTWGRARQLYLIHLVLLAVAFTLVAWIADSYGRPAARNLLGFYFDAPLPAIIGGAALIYQPPLLDILPLYILLMAGTPLAMGIALSWSWGRVLAISFAIWLAAQLGLREAWFTLLAGPENLRLALQLLGSFDLFAWQFLWVLGLWFGADGLRWLQADPVRLRGFLNVSLAVAAVMFAWRHLGGQHGWMDAAQRSIWIDKWSLSPLRLVNLAALIGALMAVGPALIDRLRLTPFEQLGRSSLWVFVAHLASLLLLLCVVGPDDQLLRGAVGLATLATGFAALFFAAYLHRRYQAAARA
ncbi:OpgC domain-containing protein [Panacagrimonas sp.]|uniref:OpgC domain-containing protein n=1 Tax=Panacagrimonas sp. TaxID=2480088 RepID=UPI003B527AD7